MSKPKLRRPRHTRVPEVGLIEVSESTYSQEVTLKFTCRWRDGESGPAEVEIKLRPAEAADVISGLRGSMERIVASLQRDLKHALESKP